MDNLRAEMARNRIKHEIVASELNITTRALSNKLNGRSKFTTEEAFKIRDKFFPDLKIEYLFGNN